ncbi:MAG TPA: hypothetical protein VJC06_01875 [Candidatus Paceibacterota bacterium]
MRAQKRPVSTPISSVGVAVDVSILSLRSDLKDRIWSGQDLRRNRV